MNEKAGKKKSRKKKTKGRLNGARWKNEQRDIGGVLRRRNVNVRKA